MTKEIRKKPWNKNETYKCFKCGEWFRLKMTLNHHKCEEKERKYG